MLARRRAFAVTSALLLLAGPLLSGIAPTPVRADSSSSANHVSPWTQGVGADDDGAPSASTHDVSLSTPWTVFDTDVDVVGGNLSFAQKDLTIPSIGLATTIARTYDSAAASVDGPFGYGWSWSYGLGVTAVSGGVDVVRADGRVDFYASGSSGYTPPPGIYDTLASTGVGGWTLTLVDQTVYTFAADGSLTSESDPNGNTLTLAYTDGLVSSLTDTAGRTWTFLAAPDGGHVGEIDDPAGRKVSYSYSTDGDLVGVTDATGVSESFVYTSHELTSRTDADGNATTYAYNADDSVASVTDALSDTTSFAYDGTSLTTTVTDPRGNAHSYTYDSSLRVTVLTDALGHAEYWTWDGSNDKTAVTDRNGGVTRYTFDAAGDVTQVVDAAGGTSSATFDGRHHPISKTDAAGRTTTYAYDSNGNLSSVTDPLSHSTTYAYDLRGQRVSLNDGDGHTTAYTYDSEGDLASSTDALGEVARRGYDAAGRETSATDPDGRITSYIYDADGRVLSSTDGAGGTTSSTYDAAGNLLTLTDADGNVSHYTYDAANRLVTSTDALGHATTYAYDAVGNRTGATDPLGHSTTTAYDLDNRATRVTDPDGHSTTTAYDAVGNRSSVTDANGHTTTYSYDALNRLVGVTDPAGGHATYVYDAVGNMTSVTDPDGHTTTTTYDALNRPTSEIDPLTDTSAYQYDAVGNLIQSTDANGVTTHYTYDAANRLIRSDYAEGTVTYSYDKAGDRTGLTDQSGTSTYTYDGARRLTGNTSTAGAVTYSYDAAGNLTSLTNPDGTSVAYGYDALNREVSVTDSSGQASRFGYDAAGRRTTETQPNGTQAAYGYDPAGQVTSIVWTGPSGSVASLGYTYDAAGNTTQIVDATGTSTFGYDSLDRLTAAAYPNGTTESYAYDAAGNRTSMTVNGTTTTYTYDAANRMTSLGGETVTWDANGDLLSEGTRTYTYDSQNRLISVQDGALVEQFAYDGANRRTSLGANGVVTSYGYDEHGVLPRVVTETQPGISHVYGLDGQVLWDVSSDKGLVYYSQDAMGSTVALTGPDGSVTGTCSYDAFGAPQTPLVGTGSYWYDGQQYDENSGLIYLRARYYDPATGRFLSPDSAAPDLTNPQTLDKYTYAENNPLRYADPSGKSFWDQYTALVGYEQDFLQVAAAAQDFAPAMVPLVAAPAVAWVASAVSDVALLASSVTIALLPGVILFGPGSPFVQSAGGDCDPSQPGSCPTGQQPTTGSPKTPGTLGAAAAGGVHVPPGASGAFVPLGYNPYSTPSGPPPAGTAWFCTQTNYRGCVLLGIGEYPDLTQYGLDRSIVAIEDNGVHITLYDQQNLQGNPSYYDSSVTPIANTTRSIRIERIGVTTCNPGTDGVILYRNNGYDTGGGCLFTQTSIPDLTPTTFDNSIDSLQIVGSFVGVKEVLLYNSPDYQNLCGAYWQNWEDLRPCSAHEMSVQIVDFTAPAPIPIPPGTFYAGNAAVYATRDGANSGALVDGDLSTEWLMNGAVEVGFSWPNPVTTGHIIVWDRKPASDGNGIGTLSIGFSDGTIINKLDMIVAGPRCVDVTFPAKTVSWIDLIPIDGAISAGFREVEIWATSGQQYSQNTCANIQTAQAVPGVFPAPSYIVPPDQGPPPGPIDNLVVSTVASESSDGIAHDASHPYLFPAQVHYDTLTVKAGAYASVPAWNGSTGGSTQITVDGLAEIDGVIEVSGLGYRGGPPVVGATGGYQGESWTGLGKYALSPNGGGGGGGGGADSGGGGGAYATAGGQGNGPSSTPAASGGVSYGDSTISTLYLGSGGGSSGAQSADFGAPGGAGGGAISIVADQIVVTGRIGADGAPGGSVPNNLPNVRGGGGGSGGSILLHANSISVGTGLISAIGGTGGYGYDDSGTNASGGSGSVGRIRIEYSQTFSGSTTPAANAAKFSNTPTPDLVVSTDPTQSSDGQAHDSTNPYVLLPGLTFHDVTVQAGAFMTTVPWNGSSGGTLALTATGNVRIDGTVTVVGDGYRGGPPVQGADSGIQGESTSGVGAKSSQPNNGGGGGGSSADSGGGGGGYGSAGQAGEGPTGESDTAGGLTYGDPTLATPYLGSGGGSSGAQSSAVGAPGGAGGGAIVIAAMSIVVTGTLSANGQAGSTIQEYSTNWRGGGGGSGGSILLHAPIIDVSAGAVTATGGAGGYGIHDGKFPASGGSGGDGRVRLEYIQSVAGATTPAACVASYGGPLDHLVLNPASVAITAGSVGQTYTVTAYDTQNDVLGDVTGSSTISIAPDGSCNGASCTATLAGSHTITASEGGQTTTATLVIVPSGLDHLVLGPASATIQAGGSQAYTGQGFDVYGNGLGDQTLGASFSIAPDGSCSGATCTATVAGSHTVTASKGGRNTTATLVVVPAGLDYLVLSPASATINVGASQAYTAEGFDIYGNDLGDVTSASIFTVSGGSCAGVLCTSPVAGDQTVTAADGTATGVATLHVKAYLPGAPTGVTATAGNGSALVSWSSPADNGGSTITGYTVTSSPDSHTCTWTSGPLSCTVFGLTNGTPYTFSVTATNGAGTGPASDPSNSVTPANVPGTTTGVTATAGNGSALVSWTAPADNGSAIMGYTVTSDPDSQTCTWTAGPLSCTVANLTNGQAYTFTVTATNGAGTGLPSSASSPVTPATVPDAPTGVTATRSNGSALVSWTAPADNGSAITLYTVTSSPASDGVHTCTWTSGPLSCTVSGLTNGQGYTFTVTATNGLGTSDPSTASGSVTPANVPGAPTGVTAVAGNASASVSWTAPASDGGSPITGYTVTSSPGGYSCTWTAGPLSCTVSSLANGTWYSFGVTATNGVGPGLPGTSAPLILEPTLVRYSGSDVFATAAAVSFNTFASPCHCTAYIAYAYNFPDALAGAAAAGTVHGPILFVATSGAIDSYTASELTRLEPDHIVVLGGIGVISAAVFTALEAYAPAGQTVRYAGADRFATAAAVSLNTFSAKCGCTAYVATAYNFPDALAAAAAAGTVPGPVLLVSASGAINASTKAELKRLAPAHIVVLGGTGAVSTAVYNLLKGYAPAGQISRYYGSDRYATAAAVSHHTFSSPCHCSVYISAGSDFNGALSAAAAAGTLKGPLLLVSTSGALPASTVAELKSLQPNQIIVVGSTALVPTAVFNLLAKFVS